MPRSDRLEAPRASVLLADEVCKLLSSIHAAAEAARPEGRRSAQHNGDASRTQTAGEFLARYAQALRALKEDASRLFATTQNFHFIESPLVHALYWGKWVLIQGINHAPQAVIERLNSLLESTPKLCLLEESAEGRDLTRGDGIHDDFQFFATSDDGDASLSSALLARVTLVQVAPPETPADVGALVYSALPFGAEQSILWQHIVGGFYARLGAVTSMGHGDFSGAQPMMDDSGSTIDYSGPVRPDGALRAMSNAIEAWASALQDRRFPAAASLCACILDSFAPLGSDDDYRRRELAALLAEVLLEAEAFDQVRTGQIRGPGLSAAVAAAVTILLLYEQASANNAGASEGKERSPFTPLAREGQPGPQKHLPIPEVEQSSAHDASASGDMERSPSTPLSFGGQPDMVRPVPVPEVGFLIVDQSALNVGAYGDMESSPSTPLASGRHPGVQKPQPIPEAVSPRADAVRPPSLKAVVNPDPAFPLRVTRARLGAGKDEPPQLLNHAGDEAKASTTRYAAKIRQSQEVRAAAERSRLLWEVEERSAGAAAAGLDTHLEPFVCSIIAFSKGPPAARGKRLHMGGVMRAMSSNWTYRNIFVGPSTGGGSANGAAWILYDIEGGSDQVPVLATLQVALRNMGVEPGIAVHKDNSLHCIKDAQEAWGPAAAHHFMSHTNDVSGSDTGTAEKCSNALLWSVSAVKSVRAPGSRRVVFWLTPGNERAGKWSDSAGSLAAVHRTAEAQEVHVIGVGVRSRGVHANVPTAVSIQSAAHLGAALRKVSQVAIDEVGDRSIQKVF